MTRTVTKMAAQLVVFLTKRIDGNVLSYLFGYMVSGREAHSCTGQSERSPFGLRLSCLTVYVADAAGDEVSLMKYK